MTIDTDSTPRQSASDEALELIALAEQINALPPADRLAVDELLGGRQPATPDDEYPDREILGVVIPGALAKEADDIILGLITVRAQVIAPLVARAEAHTSKLEAVASEVAESLRGAVTDEGAVDEVTDGIHRVLSEMTEHRRLSAVAYGIASVITDADI